MKTLTTKKHKQKITTLEVKKENVWLEVMRYSSHSKEHAQIVSKKRYPNQKTRIKQIYGKI